MSRQELNNAIWKVLNTKFKKDAREAFKAVEDAGYYVYKDGCGYWVVANNKTNRYVNLAERGWKRYTHIVIQHGPYTTQSRELSREEQLANTSKFDFVGCLEKPVNTTWYDMRNGWKSTGKLTAHGKYNDIQHSKRMVEYCDKEIDDIQKKIAELQRRLIREVESKAKYEQTLATQRAEYGLTK